MSRPRHAARALTIGALCLSLAECTRGCSGEAARNANQGSLEIVQMMVERGTDPQAAINRAVSMRQPAAVEYLVAAKADMLSLRIAF